MKANKLKKYNWGGYVQAGMGLAQMGAGWYQAQRANAAIKRILADAPKIETPAAYYELAKEAYNQELLQQQLADINRDLGTTTSSLSQAGGRALVGGLSKAVDYGQQQKAAVYGQESQQRLAAQQMLAQREDITQQQREARLQQQLAAGRAAKQAAQQNIMGGLGAIAEGSLFAGGLGDTQSLESTTQPQPKVPTLNKRRASKSTIMEDVPGDAFKSKYFQKGTLKIDDFQTEPEYFAKKGMKVKKTNGEFSHESNPIDIVQKGEKIGEMTGGEYIFNPTQVSKIKQLIKSKNKAGLEKYMGSLVKKFENI